jgi:uncharacterized protein (TIGR03435 family)
MDDAHFDAEAKMPFGANRDQANEMLQALLAECFGVELHRDAREMAGFTLLVGKRGAKLEDFVPPTPPPESLTPEEARERREKLMQEMPKTLQARAAQQGSGTTPLRIGSSSSWRGVTTAQLAERLTSRTGGPVVDETGLTGKYNVTTETWAATEDEPEQTVFTALEQMGLRLERRKLNVEFLVIDKISRTPAAN